MASRRRRRPDLDVFMAEHGLKDMDGFLGKRPMTAVEMSLARQGMISEFFDAARAGNAERVQRLLKTEYRVAMVRATTPNGATAFFIACEKVSWAAVCRTWLAAVSGAAPGRIWVGCRARLWQLGTRRGAYSRPRWPAPAARSDACIRACTWFGVRSSRRTGRV